jgi:hypothetical protein
MKMVTKFLNLVKKLYNNMKNKILNWQWFRDFFNITIFKYFVTWFAIVPVFSKLSEQLPKNISIQLNPVKSYTINLELPFKWEILWVSSLFFVFAYILYLIFSPTFVKRYFSYKDYKDYGHSPRWIVREAQNLVKSKYVDLIKFSGRMIKKDYIHKINDNEDFEDKEVIVSKKETSLMFKSKSICYKFSMPIVVNEKEDKELTEIAVREVFWEVFARFSDSKFGIRLIIQLFLIISLITFSIPFIESIVSGFKYLIK